jgi:hypothetical protein
MLGEFRKGQAQRCRKVARHSKKFAHGGQDPISLENSSIMKANSTARATRESLPEALDCLTGTTGLFPFRLHLIKPFFQGVDALLHGANTIGQRKHVEKSLIFRRQIEAVAIAGPR